MVSDVNTFYQLDPGSGVLTLQYVDEIAGTDGFTNAIAGLAYSKAAANPDQLFAYDVNGYEDIFTYDPGNSFARAYLFATIIPNFNAGRGDLAAQISPLLHLSRLMNITNPAVLLAWTTNAPNYVLQSTLSLAPANWNLVTNTGSIVGTQFTVPIATTNTQQFFRLYLP